MNKENKGTPLFFLYGVPLFGAYLIALSSFITQYCAGRLSYHSALGTPWFDRFYAPWSWFAWQVTYYKGAPTTFNYAYLMCLIGIGIGVLGLVVLNSLVTRKMKRHEDVHGTAHFASRKEIEDAGLLPRPKRGLVALFLRLTFRGHLIVPKNSGVYCGGWTDEKGQLHYLRHDGPEHVAIIAPTRSGKGVALVNPTLLTWTDSVVATDLKGELFHGTAGWRAKYANNIVYNFVPGSMNSQCQINPLEEVRIGSPEEVSDVQNIATIIVDPSGRGIDRLGHFEKTAQQFLIGLILHVLYKVRAKENRIANLGDVCDELSDPNRPVTDLYDEMMRNQHLAGNTLHPVVARSGAQQANRPEEERGSVHSTATSFFALYDDPIVRHNVSRSSFRINDLMNAERPITLFLAPRPEDKDRLKPLTRLIISQVLRVLLRPELQFKDGQQIPPHKRRLLFLGDEFPSFGKLEVLEEQLAYMAGYGIKAYLITQDMSQLWDDAAYGRNEKIMSNCHIRICYAPNKPETAEWISKMTGVTTVVKEHYSYSGKRFGAVLQQASVSLQEQSRPLMTADEIMRMKGPRKDAKGQIESPGDVLVFAAGHAPIKGTQSLYFLNPTLLARWGLPYDSPQWKKPEPILEPDVEEFVPS